jgi:hypothetical protein
MSALFKTPKVRVPKVEPPAPIPTIDDAARQRTESDRLRRRRGVRDTMRTGPLGAVIPATAAAPKQLTGQ